MNNYGKSGLEYQSHYLLNVLLESSLTEYGQKYSFSSCTSIEEFQQKVPLSDYETNKYYIEKMMRGEKKAETNDKRIVHPDWPWTNPSYEIVINRPIEDIASIEIDPSKRMADVNSENNKWEAATIETNK